jgi:glycerol-3-phosphate O-acyltransferase
LIVTAIDWGFLVLAALLVGGLVLWTVRRTRLAIQRWFNRAVLRTVRRFRARVDRYKLVAKGKIRAELLSDPVIIEAIRVHCATQSVTEEQTRAAVRRYIDEIVPHFNVLSYYRFGYNVARALVGLLYRVSTDGSEAAALSTVPRQDTVIYLMNHRGNADYLVVAYVLAGNVSVSYALGEWARVWPLEYVFKSFGAYFVRRGFRNPLYQTVLRRYVQLITRNGVTQGIFLEGGLSRDGRFRVAKIGLLDAIVTALSELPPDRDIHLVPVALNYDRVLEDRTLIRDVSEGAPRPGRLRRLSGVVLFVTRNVLRFLTGNLRRYGRVAVHFGPPTSLRGWSNDHPGVLHRPKSERMEEVQKLADAQMAKLAELIPVTPVPLTAAALLSFGETLVPRDRLFERLEEYHTVLREAGAYLTHPEHDAAAIFDRAWRTLRMRRLVVRTGDAFVILPLQRPLLEYYANSIRHLLPEQAPEPVMHPAHEPDTALPRLKR